MADGAIRQRTDEGRAAELSYILSNSFGFGGINACVVLGRV